MAATVRRAVAAALALALVAALGLAIARSAGVVSSEPEVDGPVEVVQGISGSEKIEFLTDPRVVARFRELGLEVEVNAAGSREIATESELAEADFAFPGGAPAAAGIEAIRPAGGGNFTPFVTPMVIASWRPVADALTAQGVVRQRDGHLEFDVDAYLALFDAGTRWSQLGLESERRILVTTTDVRRSNSAGMYLALVSYSRNGQAIVSDRATADGVLDQIWPLFAEQGFTASSTQSPFEAYLVRGRGAVPMVMVYESQYLAAAAAQPSPIQDDMVLLYPTPTVFATHTLLAFTEAGRRLGQALAGDDELRALATEFGFRVDDASFQAFAAEHDVVVPDQLADTVEPPSFEILEYMIADIEKRYGQ